MARRGWLRFSEVERALRRPIVIAALGLAALSLAACKPAVAPFNNVDITGAEYARGFSLPDSEGKLRTLPDFQGKAVAVFFGYLNCPDICPTALGEWKAVKEQLAKQSPALAERLQVVFISVDPARDRPAVVGQYVRSVDPGFVGLVGDEAATQKFAKEFKVLYSKEAGKTPDTYTINHSAGSYVFDPQGRVRLFVRHQQPIEALAADITRLLN